MSLLLPLLVLPPQALDATGTQALRLQGDLLGGGGGEDRLDRPERRLKKIVWNLTHPPCRALTESICPAFDREQEVSAAVDFVAYGQLLFLLVQGTVFQTLCL